MVRKRLRELRPLDQTVPVSERVILSLCCRTGNWPRYYAEAGYPVVSVDLDAGEDVRLQEYPGRVWGILAAPPCTEFSKAGARHWERKGTAALLEGLSVVDACLRIITMARPTWWALENPLGRLRRYLGPPVHAFDPWEYAGAAPDPEAEAYTKRTLLWGSFAVPAADPVALAVSDWTSKIGGDGDKRSAARSVTPLGFARAFMEANP